MMIYLIYKIEHNLEKDYFIWHILLKTIDNYNINKLYLTLLVYYWA